MNTEQLQFLIQKSGENKKVLNFIKRAAVCAQLFELASELREFEKERFPETEEDKVEKIEALKVKTLLGMLELNVTDDIAYLVYKAFKMHSEMGGKFTLDDAFKIRQKKNELYPDLG